MKTTLSLTRAAEIIKKLRKVDTSAACDLFIHFDDVYRLGALYRNDGGKTISNFVEMCGYLGESNIKTEDSNEYPGS